MRKATVFLVLAMFVIAVLVTGCGGGDKKPAEQPKAKGPSGTLMIYTSIYPDIVELVKPAIAKTNTTSIIVKPCLNFKFLFFMPTFILFLLMLIFYILAQKNSIENRQFFPNLSRFFVRENI